MEKKEHNQAGRDVAIKNKEKCHNLLLLSQKIRYVGIINRFCRKVAGQLRVGLISLLNVEQVINEHFVEATRNQLIKAFYDSLYITLYSNTINKRLITLLYT